MSKGITENIMPYLSFLAHKDNRAWQGIATDGNYIYVTTDRSEDFELQNIISVYDMFGNYVKEKIDAYTGKDYQGKFMSFGDCSIIENRLFVTAYNFNSGGRPAVSRVLEYSLPELILINENDIGEGTAEGIVKYKNYYWVSYHDLQGVRKFDTSYKLIKEYELSQPISENGGYQGLIWENGDLYLIAHGSNWYGEKSYGKIHRYSFDGEKFTFIEAMEPISFGATQGICKFNGLFYFNDRVANRILISNNIKPSKLKSAFTKITNHDIIKPTLLNNWLPFDNVFDRTLKIWKDAMGVVHLEGIVKCSGNIPSTICKLPEGYRPQYSRNFAVDSGGKFGRVAIVGNNSHSPESDSGNIVLAVGDNAYACLDGINFLADPTQ